MADFIKPTIGRKVYYFPKQDQSYAKDAGLDNIMVQFEAEILGHPRLPLDATIVYVWNDTCVNLLVVDHMGNTFKQQSVSINNGSNTLPRAEWMDYQKGQAAKTEALAAELDKVIGAKDACAKSAWVKDQWRMLDSTDGSKLQASAPSAEDGRR